MRNKTKSIILVLLVLVLMPVLAFGQRDSTTRCLGGPSGRGCPPEKTREEKVRTLRNLTDAQVNRTEKAIDRLSGMIDRIETVTQNLKEKGLDASSVSSKISSAQNLKSEAETQLKTVKEKYSSIDPNEPRKSVQTFMKEMKALKEKLIKLHRALTGIVTEMKKLERSQRP